jgi:hypothetical protein
MHHTWKIFILLCVHPEILRYRLQSFQWISLKTQAFLRVSLGFPYWLGDSPRCSHTYQKCSHSVPVSVMWDPRYSEGRSECPPRVWFSPELDASLFTLHLLSHTPGDSDWLEYIVLIIQDRASQWCQGFQNPRAAGCKCHTECSQIVSANPQVKENGSKGVADGRYNANEVE